MAKSPLPAPVLPLVMMMTGAYLVWFGVKYWEDTKTIWPSDPVKAILTGGTLPAASPDTPASAILASSETTAAQEAQQSSSSSSTGSGGTSASSGSAQTQAKNLLPGHGWGAAQFAPLLSLWTRESDWSAKARNPSSGAFGIAQALGHGNGSATAADDGTNEYGGFGLTDAQAKSANSGVAYWQIVWGLNYIAATYGSPSQAWSHEESAGWY